MYALSRKPTTLGQEKKEKGNPQPTNLPFASITLIRSSTGIKPRCVATSICKTAILKIIAAIFLEKKKKIKTTKVVSEDVIHSPIQDRV